MIKRRRTRTVQIGTIHLGSRWPVAIQSMTKVPTTDVSRCVRQISQLVQAGCSLVRLAVPRRADTLAFARIVDRVDIPLIADIHFSAERAVESIEAGASKIRLNPGNIKNPRDLVRIIDAARIHRTAIRIGVNEASIRDLGSDAVSLTKRVALMKREMTRYVRIFEKNNFSDLVLSAKSSDAVRTIEINRMLSDAFDYPLHLGLTHAGLPEDAALSSAVTLGSLLAEGIGDTIRVSAAGNPLQEIQIARRILETLNPNLRKTPELIVCPTCGRTEVALLPLARRIRNGLKTVDSPIRVAVMGCVVNGPGEAADADIAVCGARGKAYLYRSGRRLATVTEAELIPSIMKIIQTLENESKGLE